MIVELLSAEVFAFMLVFCRIGSAMMVLPGFGESYVLMRLRLFIALIFSLLVMPIVSDSLPLPPQAPVLMIPLVAGEIVFGLFVGATVRLAMMVLHFGGSLIAMQSGLAAAAFFDPAENTQSTITSNILSTAALTLIFVTGAHVFMLEGLVATYEIHQPAFALPIESMTEVMARLSADALVVALKIAAPLTIVGLMIYAVMGILNRLMPNFQVFFIIIPAQLALSLLVFMMALAGALYAFLGFLELAMRQVTG
jgi:flagellar biosynthetic protein FliR